MAAGAAGDTRITSWRVTETGAWTRIAVSSLAGGRRSRPAPPSTVAEPAAAAEADFGGVADHPRGRLTLTMVMLRGLAAPGVRFTAYLPADDDTAAALGTPARAGVPPV